MVTKETKEHLEREIWTDSQTIQPRMSERKCIGDKQADHMPTVQILIRTSLTELRKGSGAVERTG